MLFVRNFCQFFHFFFSYKLPSYARSQLFDCIPSAQSTDKNLNLKYNRFQDLGGLKKK